MKKVEVAKKRLFDLVMTSTSGGGGGRDLFPPAFFAAGDSAGAATAQREDSAAMNSSTSTTTSTSRSRSNGVVGIFWDIENCNVPHGKGAAAAADRVREQVVTLHCILHTAPS